MNININKMPVTRIIEGHAFEWDFYTPKMAKVQHNTAIISYKEIFEDKTPISATLYFSAIRKSFAELARPYLSKTKKNVLAEYGHITTTTAKTNFSNALNPRHKRKATAEHLFIFSMYFRLTPAEANHLFITCEEINRSLDSFSYAGKALYLFLKKEIYDYNLFMEVLCEGYARNRLELPEIFSGNQSWQEKYNQCKANMKQEYKNSFKLN